MDNQLGKKRVSVTSIIPKYLQPVIPHDYFTPMQSESLSTWYKQHNILISAPTGSGKSICFDLAILRMIHHRKGNPLPKVLFLAPIRSICKERAHDWKKRLVPHLGLRVEILVGDVSVDCVQNADIIVTTAEKFDSLLRSEDENGLGVFASFITKIGLLLIDEVHHVGGSRGKVLELVITRMLMTAQIEKNYFMNRPISSLRIIAVSATIGNPADLARWLLVPVKPSKTPSDIENMEDEDDKMKNQLLTDDIDPDNGLLVFDETYRPVPLHYIVLGYYARNQWQISKEFDKHILSVLLQYGQGKPAIVFCTSRLQTISAAESLFNKLSTKNELVNNFPETKRQSLNKYAQECQDNCLKRLLPAGIAIHNADMSESVQHLVELMLRQSLIVCLFSTSTLAQGVNFPIRLVVVYGTSIYDNGNMRQYDPNIVLQMCGRAGRQGLDDHGVAVIMTARDTVRLYQTLGFQNVRRIESQLMSSQMLDECVNVEIARGAVSDLNDAEIFLTNTYIWTCKSDVESSNVQENEGDLQEESQYKQRPMSMEKVLSIVQHLVAAQLIEIEPDMFSIHSTELGSCMARYSLSLKTINVLKNEINNLTSVNKVFNLVSSVDEVCGDVIIRRSEKKRLNELNQQVRGRVDGRVKTVQGKVKVLLQSSIECKEKQDETWAANIALYNESQRILRSAIRVCRALFTIIFTVHPTVDLSAILTVTRSLFSSCPRDSISILRHHIGPSLLSSSHARLLVRNGLNTISNLCISNSEIIAERLRSSSTLVNKILRRATRLPQFTVKAVVFRDAGGGGRVIGLDVHFWASCPAGVEQLKGRKTWSGFIIFIDENSAIVNSLRFKLNDVISDHQIIHHLRNEDGARWIDILVGCENVLGLDHSCRFAEGGRQVDHDHEISYSTNLNVQQSPSDEIIGIANQLDRVDQIHSTDSPVRLNNEKSLSSEIQLPVATGRISKQMVLRSQIGVVDGDPLSNDGDMGLHDNNPAHGRIDNGCDSKTDTETEVEGGSEKIRNTVHEKYIEIENAAKNSETKVNIIEEAEYEDGTVSDIEDIF